MNDKEILEGLKKTPYDFIACNYYKMSKEQLKDIALELLALSLFDDAKTYEKARKELVENLIECKGWCEIW